MALSGLHLLLTYMCNSQCDHCFLFSGPSAKGTFTLEQMRNVLDEAAKIGTIESICFEGGEPFLFYPVMLEGVRMARNAGFKAGIVTNAYFATSEKDAELWLRPLRDAGLSEISISDDSLHYEDQKDSPAKRALNAAKRLGLPAGAITICKPTVEICHDKEALKGKPVVGGGVMLRGRAVEKLVEGLPRRPWQEFTECPHEDLRSPKRVHLDPLGNVHLCQGLCMDGNMWQTPLSELVKAYDAESHPVCGPLVRGGPAGLARELNLKHDDGYVDACHFCYVLRLSLLDRFPQCLKPRQVYGLEQ